MRWCSTFNVQGSRFVESKFRSQNSEYRLLTTEFCLIHPTHRLLPGDDNRLYQNSGRTDGAVESEIVSHRQETGKQIEQIAADR